MALAAGLAVLCPAGAGAQLPPGAEGREPLVSPEPPPSLGPGIEIPTMTAPALGVPPGAESATVPLRGIEIVGVTAYPAGTFDPLFAGLIGQTVPLSRIFEVAQAVEQRYRDDGYVLSRAVIPAQTVSDGIFRVQVIEGYISRVATQGDVGPVKALIESYLAKVTERRPARLQDLERALLLANDIPGITARGVLRADSGVSGAAQLIVDLRREAFEGFAQVDNRASDFTGPWEAVGRFATNSYTRFGEQAALTLYSALDGDESRYGRIDVEGRFGDTGLSARAYASYSPSEPGASLAPLELESEALRFGVAARYPVIRTRRTSLWIDGGFEWADISVDSLGTTFSRDHLRVLFADAEVSHRDGLMGISQFQVGIRQGLGIFGATEDNDFSRSRADADGSFTALSFSAWRLQRLFPGFNLYVAASGQYAFDPLLADEEFALGGTAFGRGYDPAELSGDHGLGGTVELQYSPDFGLDLVDDYQIYAFLDGGIVWQKNAPGDDSESLSSAGAGVRANVNDWLSVNLEAAKPLSREPTDGDRGVQFYFSVAARF